MPFVIFLFSLSLKKYTFIPQSLSGKEFASNSGDTRDAGSIPGLGRSPKGNGNLLQYSCWRIPWIEEPEGLQSIGLQRVGHD